jgi:hypothetical protein
MAKDDAFWEANPQEDRGESESAFPSLLARDDFEHYAKDETVLLVTAVREQDTKFGKSFFVDVETPSGKRSKVFSIGEENLARRDKMIRQMSEHLEGGGEPIPVVCVFWGAAHSFARPN